LCNRQVTTHFARQAFMNIFWRNGNTVNLWCCS
jgi:hypothetical protein